WAVGDCTTSRPGLPDFVSAPCYPDGMKAALFCTSRYIGDAPQGVWPVPSQYCNPEIAEQSMAVTMEQFRLADVFGFDWVTVAEHHFSSLSLTPNPMIFAGALSQVVKRAKIAVLGPS